MADDRDANLLAYLQQSPVLTAFCRQNGWIDNASLQYEIKQRDTKQLRVAVQFDEVIMEGAGCVAGTLPCFGELQIWLGADNEVVAAHPL